MAAAADDGRGPAPDPSGATDHAEFAACLRRLMEWAGHDSTRTVATRARRYGEKISYNTVDNLITGRTAPRMRTLQAFLAGCDLPVDQHQPWIDTHARLWGKGGPSEPSAPAAIDDPRPSEPVSAFAGTFHRLRGSWLDPTAIFDDVSLPSSIERGWLIRQLDAFLADAQLDRGCFVIEADAGLGKTTVAAWLVWKRGYAGHFTRSPGGRTATTALRNLAAQLIAGFHLTEFLHAGTLPDEAREPGWFEHVLRTSAERSAAQGRPLVIVIDGLDEADLVPGRPPLGLPSTLPPNAYLVLTCRSGTPLTGLGEPRRYASIEAESAPNVADIRSYLVREATTEPVAALVAASGLSVDMFVAVLGERCAGVWIYLRYVLDEIRAGTREVANLATLPAGLADYYAENLLRVHADPRWASVGEPVLATLAVLRQPVRMGTLAPLSGVTDHGAVRRFCHQRWRPFLRIDGSGESTRYALAHESLRDFLLGATPSYTWHLSTELAEDAVSAHRRICRHYGDLFGDPAHGMAALAADAALLEIDDRYPLRHLGHHFLSAGRGEDLHRLLRANRSDGAAALRNTWYDAHLAIGATNEYLDDLRHARRHAERETDAAVTAGRPASHITSEVRCALMTASVTTAFAAIPEPLLARLLTTGHWSLQQALGRARLISSVPERIKAYCLLMPRVGGVLADQLFQELLADLDTLPYFDQRITALARILPVAERDMTPVVTEACDRIVNEELWNDRPWAAVPDLVVLAPHLSPDRVELALDLLVEIEEDSLAVDVLLALHERIDEANVDRAVARVATLPPGPGFVDAAVAVLPWVREPRRSRLLGDATSTLLELSGVALVNAAVAMAPFLPPELVVEHARRAVEDASHEPVALARCVAVAGEILPSAEARRWSARAVAELLDLPDDADFSLEEGGLELVAELVQLLSPDQRRRAAASVDVVAPDDGTTAVVAALAAHLPDPQRHRLVMDTLAAVCDLDDDDPEILDFSRVRHLKPLVVHLPPEGIRTAVDLLSAMSMPDSRAEAAAALVPRLDGAERTAVLRATIAAVSGIDDRGDRNRAIGAIAPVLPPSLLDLALATTDDLVDGSEYVDAMAALLPHLPRPQAEAVADVAAGIARSLPEAMDDSPGLSALVVLEDLAGQMHRSGISPARLLAAEVTADCTVPYFTELVTRLAEDVPGESVVEVAHAALADPDLRKRAYALAALAPRLPGDVRDRLLTDLLDGVPGAGLSVYGVDWRGEAVCVLADLMTETVASRVLDMIGRLDLSAEDRSRALQRLPARLPRHRLPAALAMARAIPNPAHHRVMAVAAVARVLPEDERLPVVDCVLRDIRAIDDGYFLSHGLDAVADLLPASLHGEALDLVAGITNGFHRPDALATILPHLHPDLWDRAVAVGRAAATDANRPEMLAALADVVVDHRRTLVAEILDLLPLLVDREGRPDAHRRCHILGRIAAYLTEDQASAAAAMIRDLGMAWGEAEEAAPGLAAHGPTAAARVLDALISPSGDRSQQLSLIPSVLPYLSAGDVGRAVDAIADIKSAAHRVAAYGAAVAPLWQRGDRRNALVALHHSMSGTSRTKVLSSIAANVDTIVALGGTGSAENVAQALQQILQWFP